MTTRIASTTPEEQKFIERICRISDHDLLWMLWVMWHVLVAFVAIGLPLVHLTAEPENIVVFSWFPWLLPAFFSFCMLPGIALDRFRHRKDRKLQQIVVYDGAVERIGANRKKETRFQLRAIDLDRAIVTSKLFANGVQVNGETWDKFEDKTRARLEFFPCSRHIYKIDGDFVEPTESWPLRFNQRRFAIFYASIAVLITVHVVSAKAGIAIGIAWVLFLALRWESVPTKERL